MTLTNLFSDIANAIRAKTGGTAPIVAADFHAAIAGISGGGAKFDVARVKLNFNKISGSTTLNELAILGVIVDETGNYVQKNLFYSNGDFDTGDTLLFAKSLPIHIYVTANNPFSDPTITVEGPESVEVYYCGADIFIYAHDDATVDIEWDVF